MHTSTYLKGVVGLSLGGTLFAGYLSGTKLLTGDCAFNEPCPYFLGYPACWYGFAMFLAMFVISMLAMRGKYDSAKATKAILWISALGTVFAGRYVVEEVYGWLTVGMAQGYGLGFPTCVYGLVFYLIILGLSLTALRMPKAVVAGAHQ